MLNEKNMREIKKIIIHCSATNKEQDFDVEDIDRWHKARGWSGVGYHYVIRLDGTLEYGRPLKETGAHAFGHNKKSIGIMYFGGVDMEGNPSDTRTEAQKRTLKYLTHFLKKAFPKATIHGHNEFNKGKACPSFCVKSENYG